MSEQELTFVVLQFYTGLRGWLPLLGNEERLAELLELGTVVELGRTSDPQELERLMGGEEEGGSDEC